MFKKGDKVVCINVEEIGGSVPNNVTLNKTYTVDSDQDGDTNVYVIGDNGCRQGLFPKRFKLAEAAKPALDLTKPLETVGGAKFTLLTTQGHAPFPVIGYVGEREYPNAYTEDGEPQNGHPAFKLRNLPPKPLEGTAYFNVYRTVNDELSCSSQYDNRQKADEGAGPDRVGCIKVNLVEGQYDE